jgi:hypothetical protein
VRAILLGLEQSEITASENERDAEEPQHTCKLAARLLNKSSDAEPASSDEDTPSPSPPPALSKRKLLADALAALGDFATRAVMQKEEGGSKAVSGRAPMPDKYTKKSVRNHSALQSHSWMMLSGTMKLRGLIQ